MKLRRAIAAIVLVSAFAAPEAAGTFEDAVDAHARGDYATALRLIRPLANDGDASAKFNLGLKYTIGQGVQQDNAAAALWFRKTAEQGYAPAQSNLGSLYLYGRSVTQDDNEAVMWFRRAADQGDAVAEFLLGNQYASGKGVPQDFSEAIILFRRLPSNAIPSPCSISGSCMPKVEVCRKTTFAPMCGSVYRQHRVSKERSRL